LLSAFSPSPEQNFSAIGSAHSLAKAVLHASMAFLRLKRAFHQGTSSVVRLGHRSVWLKGKSLKL
jgi:hypothetical protein